MPFLQLGIMGVDAKEDPLTRRLAWITAGRLLLFTILLGVIGGINLRQGFDFASFTVQTALGTLAAAFAATGAYAFVLRLGVGVRFLVYAQLVMDQLIWTVVLYLSGGATSGAASFYGLTCFVGAIVNGLAGAMAAAVAGVLCYVTLVLSLERGLLTPPPDQVASAYVTTIPELAYHSLANLLMIVTVTLLASYLVQRLRVTGGQLVLAEQRALDAERMAELGRLAAALAHEIRNPLGSISGSIGLLSENPRLSDEDRQLCEIIRRESARLSHLATDMMELSKPRVPDIAVVDVASLAREVVKLAAQSGRGVSDVDVVYEGADTASVRADAAQLQQMLWNLVRNGVQASSAGDKVVVHVGIDQGQVELSVRDFGQGLSDEAKQRIFDAYYTTRSSGTGMGLAVVKRIADDHGYRISVENAPNRGATFRVALGPALDSPAVAVRPQLPSYNFS